MSAVLHSELDSQSRVVGRPREKFQRREDNLEGAKQETTKEIKNDKKKRERFQTT